MNENAQSQASTGNHLLISAYGTYPNSPLLIVSRRISEAGCNLLDTRLSTVGRDVSLIALAAGSWDGIVKLESLLSRIERENQFKIAYYRTGPKPMQSNMLPYLVEVVAALPGKSTKILDAPLLVTGGLVLSSSLWSSRCRPGCWISASPFPSPPP